MNRVREIVEFMVNNSLSSYLFEYLYRFKYEVEPTSEEKDSFETYWDEETSSYDYYEDSYDSYDDE